MTEDPELVAVLKKMRYDLTDMQVKVTEALRMAGALRLPSPDEFRCPDCGIECRHRIVLAEHRYHSHDGAFPEHWAAIEALAVDDAGPAPRSGANEGSVS